MKKSWTARVVTEGGTVKYTAGAASNPTPGYSKFILNLASPPNVTLTTVDGNTFTGKYELQNDKTIVLTGLTPVPTGTNGTISYTIDSVTDAELKVTRTTADPKTGGSLNSYTLKNP
ncbi:hypothetical protein J2I48_23345 [Fibrella sp. HMF5036]|uniref:Lipocalin-like domain-containing protein n=1 Tax=Fibrella aquatilis TaxID=2817059 RepID=A0A939G845_9BACT|nr:hypothetical protein [Fibrella aquatilis]